MGAGAWEVRRQDLRDYLGLEPKSAAAAVAPQRHFAAVEIPQAEQFQGTHGWNIERQLF